MPTTYSQLDSDVKERVARLLTDHYPELVEVELRVDGLFASNAEDFPIRIGGVPKAAKIESVSVRDRAMGQPDVRLTIDKRQWDTLTDDQKEALVDHEIYHVELKRNEDGTVKSDDQGRPVVGIREHDWELSGFRVIVERHGAHALERLALEQFRESVGRELLGAVGGPNPADMPRRTAGQRAAAAQAAREDALRSLTPDEVMDRTVDWTPANRTALLRRLARSDGTNEVMGELSLLYTRGLPLPERAEFILNAVGRGAAATSQRIDLVTAACRMALTRLTDGDNRAEVLSRLMTSVPAESRIRVFREMDVTRQPTQTSETLIPAARIGPVRAPRVIPDAAQPDAPVQAGIDTRNIPGARRPRTHRAAARAAQALAVAESASDLPTPAERAAAQAAGVEQITQSSPSDPVARAIRALGTPPPRPHRRRGRPAGQPNRSTLVVRRAEEYERAGYSRQVALSHADQDVPHTNLSEWTPLDIPPAGSETLRIRDGLLHVRSADRGRVVTLPPPVATRWQYNRPDSAVGNLVTVADANGGSLLLGVIGAIRHDGSVDVVLRDAYTAPWTGAPLGTD